MAIDNKGDTDSEDQNKGGHVTVMLVYNWTKLCRSWCPDVSYSDELIHGKLHIEHGPRPHGL